MPIGTLAEKSLHAALKQWYVRPGDALEVLVDGFVVDIVRPEGLLEIQTRHLYAMRRKLTRLLERGHTIRLVHPIAAEKWIVRETADGEITSRRKSPRRGRVVDVFRETVRVADVLCLPGLVFELVLVQLEETWRDDGQGSWRRKHWSLADQRLLEVVGQKVFASPLDYLDTLPPGLPDPFTNRMLAEALRCTPALAGKMTYTLRKMGLLAEVGRQGKANLFSIQKIKAR